MDSYETFVQARMAAGDDPNAILGGIHSALRVLPDWVMWGDGSYRQDRVCSICGSTLAGVCGHETWPAQRRILRREYEAGRRLRAQQEGQ